MARTKIAKSRDVQPLSGELFFQTYQTLLKHREKMDHELSKMQGKLLRMVKKNALRRIREPYVPRIHNKLTLEEAIRESMVPGEKMVMADILTSLQRKGSYRTNSKKLYTMVNNKLHQDPKIETPKDKQKVPIRGIFIYHPTWKDLRKKKKRGRPRKTTKAA